MVSSVHKECADKQIYGRASINLPAFYQLYCFIGHAAPISQIFCM